MTQHTGTDDLLAQLEQEIRKVIDDNRQFLARLHDDEDELLQDGAAAEE